jgi:hypothetical protein
MKEGSGRMKEGSRRMKEGSSRMEEGSGWVEGALLQSYRSKNRGASAQ